ncbi:MFS monocarboxylate transporter [Colletotrichum truncatum]|uniref:MFS monocarboxylate transporter n=1 Tax=Colletotrichum truncatum TaxID=5467 RepID=A0ACC3Z572_COLTU|nr:MFS monocarboxylate transporter [Colletotrichum truncatum]KAF6795125.1 MFS monocarboxylate transporter [Colletotrichum truncatum]
MTTVRIFSCQLEEEPAFPAGTNTYTSWNLLPSLASSRLFSAARLTCGLTSLAPRWLLASATTVYCASFLGVAFSSQYWRFPFFASSPLPELEPVCSPIAIGELIWRT